MFFSFIFVVLFSTDIFSSYIFLQCTYLEHLISYRTVTYYSFRVYTEKSHGTYSLLQIILGRVHFLDLTIIKAQLNPWCWCL